MAQNRHRPQGFAGAKFTDKIAWGMVINTELY